MRLILLALAALTLCACDQVYSRAPLVSEAREQGDPELRPGLWVVDGYADPKCPFDARQPVYKWPDCAIGAEYERGQWWLLTRQDRLLAQTVRLVSGDPILAQSHWSTDAFRALPVPPPADADNPFFGWTYAAVTPTRMDVAGRIVAAEVVQPVCGPPQTATLQDRPLLYRDRFKPFPGLTVSGGYCLVKDLATLKAVLQQSRPVATHAIRWLRDPS